MNVPLLIKHYQQISLYVFILLLKKIKRNLWLFPSSIDQSQEYETLRATPTIWIIKYINWKLS